MMITSKKKGIRSTHRGLEYPLGPMALYASSIRAVRNVFGGQDRLLSCWQGGGKKRTTNMSEGLEHLSYD